MQGTTFHRLTREYPLPLREDEVLISAPTIFQNTQSGAAAWLQSLIPLIIGSLSSLVLFVVSRDNPVIIYAMVGVLVISAGLTVAMRLWLQMAVKRLQRTQRDIYLKYLADEGTKLRSLAEAELLVSTYQFLGNEPFVIPLRKIGTLSIVGPRAATRALTRVILCQISAFHTPEDVHILTFAPGDALREWSWLKWLPHVRRLRQVKIEKQQAPEPLALLADAVGDYRELLIKQINPELERRREAGDDKSQGSGQVVKPHFILVLDGFSHRMVAQVPELESIVRDAVRLGVTVICIVDDHNSEPASLQTRITISPTGELKFAQTTFGGRRDEKITADSCSIQMCEFIARVQAPLSLADKGNKLDLSQDVRLLDLLGMHSADAIQVPHIWKPRARKDLLNIPIGSRSNGEPLFLDLKESAERGMGPHGLIIGTTGSGKSELLRTIVTSLAITHDTDTVNFVLADFKGGAAFAELAALPHVAGVITNLENDLTLIERMHASLLGERARRERLLHEAGKLDNIREYHIKRQRDREMAPLPHLVIIVDEFAQLLINHPEFLKLFITIGQVGRRLGLHLLLATQRLDEGRLQGLESYLHYRICLRTFNKAESSTVIGNPNAYYLPSIPGVVILRRVLRPANSSRQL